MDEQSESRKELRDKLDKLRAKLVKEQAGKRATRPVDALREQILEALHVVAPAHMSREKAEALVCDAMLGYLFKLLELLNR